MKTNKKALLNITQVIIMFAVFSMITIFIGVLMFEVGKDYIVSDIATAGKQALNNTVSANLASSQATEINTLQSDYNNFSLPFDIFFLLAWISAFSLTIYSAFKNTKEGIFNFFGYVFVGSLILLLITSYLATFTSWFQSEIFDRLFNDTTVTTPIFDFYLNNLGIINFIWWVIIVLIASIDRTYISRAGQVEE